MPNEINFFGGVFLLIDNYELVITSEPTTYSTSRELEWKHAIHAKATNNIPSNINGVNLSFRLSSNSRNGQPFDLDNLCEPVFSSLCKSGWFGGKRKNIQWWYAERQVSQPSGVTISSVIPKIENQHKKFLSATYNGTLPKNSKDISFIKWIKRITDQLNVQMINNSFGLRLQFGDEMINIGEIPTGRVKNVIDCLYPIMGGEIGKPNDWKVEKLLVAKGIPELMKDELRLDVFILD